MKTLRILVGTLASFSLLLVSGCNNGLGLGPGIGTPQILAFDFSGAVAVGTAQLESASASAVSRDAQDAFGLVKVLEDGSIELAMEAPAYMFLPPVQFIAVSPLEGSKDAYVSFENHVYYGDFDAETNQLVNSVGSLLHVKEDGSYVDVGAKLGLSIHGHVLNWSWWGNDDFKPIVFDNAGRIYFVYASWGGGNNLQVLCRYDPATEAGVQLTPAISGYEYQSFDVSADGQYLFALGHRDGSSFFRMYPVGDIENFKTIFYTSSQDVWVRGFKVSPAGDFVVFNGWNVRGTNGIVKASGLSGESLSYRTLFDSDTTNWYHPAYNSDYQWDGEQRFSGLFYQGGPHQLFLAVTNGSEVRYAQLGDLSDEYGLTAYTVDATFTTWSHVTRGPASGFYFSTDANDLTIHSGNVTRLAEFVAESPVMIYQHSEWDHAVGAVASRQAKLVRSTTAAKILAEPGRFADEQFIWSHHWFTDHDPDSGTLDANVIADYVSTLYVEDVDFYYDGMTGAGAFAAALADEPFSVSDVWGLPSDEYHFLNQHVVKAGTTTPATSFKQFREESGLGWLNFQDVSNLFFDEYGALWGVLGGDWTGHPPKPIKLLDEDGNRDLQIIDLFADDTYSPVGFALDGMNMYFRDAVLDADGYETGRHRMYRMSLANTASAPVDILADVPDNGSFEIVDFSIGNGFLYFTGVKGITLVGGKVDLVTFEYTPFDSAYRLSNIEVY